MGRWLVCNGKEQYCRSAYSTSPESLWTPITNNWGRIGCNIGVGLFCIPSLVEGVGSQVLGLR